MAHSTLLHTSDWHLGHQLYSRRRNEEFARFLDWLVALIAERNADAVVIAGDVFHTTLPDTQAQELYYNFLLRAGMAGARNIIVTAGNHDSPTFLAAPRKLLATLNVHVVGAPSSDRRNDIITLKNRAGEDCAIVCAVPFLREKDAREFAAGEDNLEKEQKLVEGIRAHYKDMAEQAEQIRAGRDIPIIATGHLFASGASPSREVRQLYIGGSGAVPADIFPDNLDYVALGHIHRPQKIGSSEYRRYSGSPIPIHFDEASQTKNVLLLHFDGRKPQLERCEIPVFRRLLTLSGSQESLLAQLRELASAGQNRDEEIWFELNHDGSDNFGDLKDNVQDLFKGLNWALLNCNPARARGRSLEPAPDRRLEDYTPQEMFRLRLEQGGYGEEQKRNLMLTFQELIALWHENGGSQ
ncbi:MAG: exonuclease subunit SbcD [Desulfovibrio sp.]|nr:exonuclease subunit SbcD [Desulfovibrio sp.]